MTVNNFKKATHHCDWCGNTYNSTELFMVAASKTPSRSGWKEIACHDCGVKAGLKLFPLDSLMGAAEVS